MANHLVDQLLGAVLQDSQPLQAAGSVLMSLLVEQQQRCFTTSTAANTWGAAVLPSP